MRSVGIADVVRDSRLQGGPKGEAHLPLLTPHLDPAGVLVLDFQGVETLTSSYFFAALWPFWTREDATGPSTFPLVANAVPDVEEEIDVVMNHRRTATWRGTWDGVAFAPKGHLGLLDEGLRVAVDRALSVGSVTAVELAQSGRNPNPTAWNNRLALLHRQRMLRRRQAGRKQIYFLPWEEASRG